MFDKEEEKKVNDVAKKKTVAKKIEVSLKMNHFHIYVTVLSLGSSRGRKETRKKIVRSKGKTRIKMFKKYNLTVS